MAKSITLPESNRACLSHSEVKADGKMPKNLQELKTAAVKFWQSSPRKEIQFRQLLTANYLQPSIKNFIYNYSGWHNSLQSLTWRGPHVTSAVIPTPVI